MDSKTLIHNAFIVNEGKERFGYLLIEGNKIRTIGEGDAPVELFENSSIIDASGKILLPGIIDCHVHFREPGLTHKADIFTESCAAVAGGVTSYMEMPNTQPQTTSIEILNQKNALASEKSLANYSFFIAANNNNLDEILNINPTTTCGIKVFLGASTGNMLVDNPDTLETLFQKSPVPITAHCEDESIIQSNTEKARIQFGDNVPICYHPIIRNVEACYQSSKKAIELAQKYNTRLHIAHISTQAELSLLSNLEPLSQKRITAEVCPHYLCLCDDDYEHLGTKMKVNPAIKTRNDKDALLQGLIDGYIDIIATDHAPHLLSEKNNTYFKAPSGMPLIQHSVLAMLQFVHEGKLSLTNVVEKMCHAPAVCYQIHNRGFIREGYYADLVLVNPNKTFTVSPDNIINKCKWSVFEGVTFAHSIEKTLINGKIAFDNGCINKEIYSQPLIFER